MPFLNYYIDSKGKLHEVEIFPDQQKISKNTPERLTKYIQRLNLSNDEIEELQMNIFKSSVKNGVYLPYSSEVTYPVTEFFMKDFIHIMLPKTLEYACKVIDEINDIETAVRCSVSYLMIFSRPKRIPKLESYILDLVFSLVYLKFPEHFSKGKYDSFGISDRTKRAKLMYPQEFI